VPFQNIGGGASTLTELLGTAGYTASPFSGSADQVTVYDPTLLPASPYVTLALWSDFGDTQREWRLISDFFTPGSGDGVGFDPAMGFWYQAAAGASATESTASGEVPAGSSVDVPVVAGFQILSYPYSATVDLNSTDLAASGATANLFSGSADQITIYTNGVYDTFALSSSGPEWRPIGAFFSAAPSLPLPLGNGFWYFAQSGFTWTESTPY
jgi:hypothetical protein